MLPFKKGAFHMAQQGQVPIVPVVFANYSHLYSGRKRFWINGVIRVKGK
jgi:1-acyl-sn-glycerol-3-phosphate acyltransferase